MSSGDRFLLLVIALALGVASIAVMASMLGAMDNLMSLLTYLLNEARWETVTVAALAIAASIYLLSLALRTTQEKAVISDTALGSVKISLRTVESVVLRAANQVKGVRDVVPEVHFQDNLLKVSVEVVVVPDVSIPDIANEVQQRVGESVQAAVGMPVADVKVSVKGLSSEGKARVG